MSPWRFRLGKIVTADSKAKIPLDPSRHDTTRQAIYSPCIMAKKSRDVLCRACRAARRDTRRDKRDTQQSTKNIKRKCGAHSSAANSSANVL